METNSAVYKEKFNSLSRRKFLQMMAYGTAGVALGTAGSSHATPKNMKDGQTQPNIIFITTDEQRFDTIGAGGNKVIQTPNLDSMAREGVIFTRTYCQAPLCQPSRASLLTGRYIHEHGQTWNQFDMKPEWSTMTKKLQSAGYHTAKIGKTHFYHGSPSGSRDLRNNADFIRSFGFNDILEEFDKMVHPLPGITTPYMLYLKEKNLLETYLKENPEYGASKAKIVDLYTGKRSRLAQENDLTSFIADRSIDWLKNYKRNKPFFLWISFVAPHPPLIDDPVWAEYYKEANIPLGPDQRPKIANNAWGRYMGGWLKGIQTQNLTPELLKESARHYYGMISLIDQRIGDILKTAEQMGYGKNTWFFFTSDHGEMLGDHGMMFKNFFYKASVLVPNIIRPPSGMEPRIVNGLTQSIDITATVTDIAGAEPPEGAWGRSLRPFTEKGGKSREVAFSELAGHRNQGNFLVMVATERYRYLYDKENQIPCELYDLQEDPDELNNLVEDHGYRKLRETLHGDYVDPFMAGRIG